MIISNMSRHIEEDFERLSELDKMYLVEKEREMIEEWQRWEEEYAEKHPVIITVKFLNENRNEKELEKVEIDSEKH